MFTSLQKGLQKPYLILPDVLTLRDVTIRKLEIVAIPGGEEEKFFKSEKQKDGTIRSHNVTKTKNMKKLGQELFELQKI